MTNTYNLEKEKIVTTVVQQKIAALASVINGLPAEIEILNVVDPEGAQYLLKLLTEAVESIKDLISD